MVFPVLGAIGLGLQIGGARKAKKAAKEAERQAYLAAADEADQLEGKARDEKAIGTYKVEGIQRQGKRVASDAKAIGAASGAGGYEGAISDIEAETEYQALTAMFNSKMSARDLKLAAKATRKHGIDAGRAIREQGRANDIDAMTGILSGAQSLYERFGKGYGETV
jgi:hypothetical protein